MKNNIKIVPLGGVRETGENLYAVNINDNIYVLDCGLRYPNDKMLGIDLIIPDFTYLRQNREKIVGVFLTNGNLHSIGALPYFLKEFDVPVFGSKLTIALAKYIVNKHNKSQSFNKFNVINENSEIIFNDTTVTFFKTTYALPGSMGIVLNTKSGKIVYTGNFKFDQTVSSKYRTDLSTVGQIGQKRVLALLGDSENGENYHNNVDESQVENYLIDKFAYTNKRVIVGCNVSNILRIQQIFNAAYKSHRKVYIVDKKYQTVANIAMKVKALNYISRALLINDKQLSQLDPSEIVILQLGKMGEPIRNIIRMANQQTGKLSITPSDLVIIATTPSHALEVQVAKTKDAVYRADGRVRMISDDLSITPDASRNDMQLILNLVHPEYLIPVEGEYRMLNAYAHLAEQSGLDARHVIIPSKGMVISFDGKKMMPTNSVAAGNTIVDGSGVGDVGNIVLRDRKVLSTEGIFIAAVTIDRKRKKVVEHPKITSRGFIYVKTNRNLIKKSAQIVEKSVQNNLNNNEFDWSYLKQGIRDSLNSYLFEKTSRHPVIMPIIMEIGQRS